MSELYIPVERPTRNPINGRFLKGIAPHNKGKTMKYHSLKTKRRSLKNLAKGRGSWHKTGAGLNRKSVVAIKTESYAAYSLPFRMQGKRQVLIRL